MSAAKKKTAAAERSPRFPLLASLFSGWGKTLLVTLVLAGVVVAVGFAVRKYVRGSLLATEEYRLTAEKIQLKPWPMPVWVQPDPRETAYRRLSQGRAISIADGDLVERVTAVFEQEPWIAKVHRVNKRYPATVEVELDYRRPVLMVQIIRGAERLYYAVDAEGISLPTEGCFTPLERARYPQLIDVETPPAVSVGKRWGDSRVIGGAEIAAALLPVWDKLHLKWIVPRAISPGSAATSANSTQSPRFGDYQFEIIAHGEPEDVHIYWGRSPSEKDGQENSPAQKVKELEDRAAERGGLDKWREIDLRTGRRE
jgi:hypothetical protein